MIGYGRIVALDVDRNMCEVEDGGDIYDDVPYVGPIPRIGDGAVILSEGLRRVAIVAETLRAHGGSAATGYTAGVDAGHGHGVDGVDGLRSALDALLEADRTLTSALSGKVSKTGDTMSGNLVVNAAVKAADLSVDAAASTERLLRFQSAGSTRWSMGANSVPESGSQAGSHFVFGRYNDAGAWVDNPIDISRTTGVVNVPNLYVGKELKVATYFNVATADTQTLLTATGGTVKVRFDSGTANVLQAGSTAIVPSATFTGTALGVYRGSAALTAGTAVFKVTETGAVTATTLDVSGWTNLNGGAGVNGVGGLIVSGPTSLQALTATTGTFSGGLVGQRTIGLRADPAATAKWAVVATARVSHVQTGGQGYVIIELPAIPSGTVGMMNIRITGYRYIAGKAFELQVGGYTYVPATISTWIHTAVGQWSGDGAAADIPVTMLAKGTTSADSRFAIALGADGHEWSYSSLTVEVHTGFSVNTESVGPWTVHPVQASIPADWTNRVTPTHTRVADRTWSAANLVNLTSNQTIAGEKTFTSRLLVKQASGASYIQQWLDSSGSSVASMLSTGYLYAGNFLSQGASGTSRGFFSLTSGASRWFMGANATAETATDGVGSDFVIYRYGNGGSATGTPFMISRSTGAVTIANGLGVSAGGVYVNGGGLTVAAGTTAVQALTANSKITLMDGTTPRADIQAAGENYPIVFRPAIPAGNGGEHEMYFDVPSRRWTVKNTLAVTAIDQRTTDLLQIRSHAGQVLARVRWDGTLGSDPNTENSNVLLTLGEADKWFHRSALPRPGEKADWVQNGSFGTSLTGWTAVNATWDAGSATLNPGGSIEQSILPAAGADPHTVLRGWVTMKGSGTLSVSLIADGKTIPLVTGMDSEADWGGRLLEWQFPEDPVSTLVLRLSSTGTVTVDDVELGPLRLPYVGLYADEEVFGNKRFTNGMSASQVEADTLSVLGNSSLDTVTSRHIDAAAAEVGLLHIDSGRVAGYPIGQDAFRIGLVASGDASMASGSRAMSGEFTLPDDHDTYSLLLTWSAIYNGKTAADQWKADVKVRTAGGAFTTKVTGRAGAGLTSGQFSLSADLGYYGGGTKVGVVIDLTRELGSGTINLVTGSSAAGNYGTILAVPLRRELNVASIPADDSATNPTAPVKRTVTITRGKSSSKVWEKCDGTAVVRTDAGAKGYHGRYSSSRGEHKTVVWLSGSTNNDVVSATGKVTFKNTHWFSGSGGTVKVRAVSAASTTGTLPAGEGTPFSVTTGYGGTATATLPADIALGLAKGTLTGLIFYTSATQAGYGYLDTGTVSVSLTGTTTG